MNNKEIYTGNILNGKQLICRAQEWEDGGKYKNEWENWKIIGKS